MELNEIINLRKKKIENMTITEVGTEMLESLKDMRSDINKIMKKGCGTVE